MSTHDDESGRSCAKHGPANGDALMTYAVVGSRVATFNHDIASKLQGLMMALDEIGEIIERAPDPDLQRAVETAQQALKEATDMLSANRALTRTTVASKTTIAALVKNAGERVGVAVRGALPDGTIETVVPLLAHGLGCGLDAIAGAGRNRAVDVSAAIADRRVTLVFQSAAEPQRAAGDLLALAAFVTARANGTLRCTKAGLEIQLPLL